MTGLELHLPILPVLVPLIGAILAAFCRRGTTAWGLALLATWAAAVAGWWLVLEVMSTGQPISYRLGGWVPPIGIEYRIDVLNAFVVAAVTSIGAVIMPYARKSVAHEIDSHNQAWFYTMYLLCLAGLLGMAVTGDAFNAFVFMEISSLSTYVLIALGRDRRALLSSYRYLIMGTIGATLYVIGVGLLYVVTGSLNFYDIAGRVRVRVCRILTTDSGGAGLSDSWREPQAGALSAARLAAECLCVCAVRCHGVSRWKRD